MAGIGFCDTGCTGTLVIGGVSLHCPAWDAVNLSKLWYSYEIRGANKLLPTVVGQRGYPHRVALSSYDLPFVLTGDVNSAGTPNADSWVGLQNNLDYLDANVFTPVTTGRGTRAATLTMPNGTVRTASVQLESLHVANDIEDPGYVEAVIHLTVVSGRFV